MLRGYLILIRFVAVIVISILASLFLEHTVHIFFDDDARDSTSTTSRCFFDDFVHYTLDYCPRPKSVTDIYNNCAWSSLKVVNYITIGGASCDFLRVGAAAAAAAGAWMRRSHHSRTVINWSRPTPEASFINTCRRRLQHQLAASSFCWLHVSNADNCHNRNKSLSLYAVARQDFS